jgi:hypothetical protein
MSGYELLELYGDEKNVAEKNETWRGRERNVEMAGMARVVERRNGQRMEEPGKYKSVVEGGLQRE